jgi:hypothetical protein
MGNWFSKEEPKITIINNNPTTPAPMTTQVSTLNLSLEEVIKEVAIVISLVMIWEYIKNRIQKKAEKEAAKIVAA